MNEISLEKSPLGKTTQYIAEYAPELLFAIPRAPKRQLLDIPNPLPFYGFDLWNAYELSWLNQKGKPIVAIGKIMIPCDSANIIESKSMKLYFNSFNNTRFSTTTALTQTIQNDLSNITNSHVAVDITTLDEATDIRTESLSGRCIDSLDIIANEYCVNPALLQTENTIVRETLHSNLLKSNCLATKQPDWASVKIQYHGRKIRPDALLKYIISYRDHLEFHEQCVERLFMDIMRQCQPKNLTVEARYTRRGGLDINPVRSTSPSVQSVNQRQIRQ